MATILNSCRVLESGTYFVSNSYANHVANVKNDKTGKAYAQGIDLVSCNASGSYVESYVIAHSSGTVIFAGTGDGYGNAVWIDHGNGVVSGYGHMKSLVVASGQKVTQGQRLGIIGNSGTSFGIHLHWSLRKYSSAYKVPPATSFWSNDSFMNKAKFTWIDPTNYVRTNLPGITYPSNISPTNNSIVSNDYNNNTVPNRFKVKDSTGAQRGAFTKYASACWMADSIKGVVIDSLNNNAQIYPVSTEDFTKSTIPNRFRVKVGSTQVGAFTNYTSAVSFAKAKGGHVYDAANGMVMIY